MTWARSSIRLASIACCGLAWLGDGMATETTAPHWAVIADAPPSALPAPRDAVVVESVVLRGLGRLAEMRTPEVRSLDAAAEAELRAAAPTIDVLPAVFCPQGGTLVHHAATRSAHIVGDVYLRVHEDRDRLFAAVDVVRPPHELVAAAVLVERERSGLVGLSSATPWTIDAPLPNAVASTCAV